MKTDHDLSQNITITEDQAFKIGMRITEARALMYLLGTVARKEPFGLMHSPDREEQHGICGLVQTVGRVLQEAFDSATEGGKPENAPESILAGGGVITALSRGNAFPRDLQRACNAGTAIRTEGSEQ